MCIHRGGPRNSNAPPRILDNFAQVSWSGFRERERVVSFPVELDDTQQSLLDLADVPRILYT